MDYRLEFEMIEKKVAGLNDRVDSLGTLMVQQNVKIDQLMGIMTAQTLLKMAEMAPEEQRQEYFQKAQGYMEMAIPGITIVEPQREDLPAKFL